MNGEPTGRVPSIHLGNLRGGDRVRRRERRFVTTLGDSLRHRGVVAVEGHQWERPVPSGEGAEGARRPDSLDAVTDVATLLLQGLAEYFGLPSERFSGRIDRGGIRRIRLGRGQGSGGGAGWVAICEKESHWLSVWLFERRETAVRSLGLLVAAGDVLQICTNLAVGNPAEAIKAILARTDLEPLEVWVVPPSPGLQLQAMREFTDDDPWSEE